MIIHFFTRGFFLFFCTCFCLLMFSCKGMTSDKYEEPRRNMVKVIEENVHVSRLYIDKERFDPSVMSVMGRVKRHKFVPLALQHVAYENEPLPIGHGQTISQPYIVALMTDLLEIKPGYKVLEIGTGSGYQAAVLAEMGVEVFTIEIIKPLADEAAKRLKSLQYDSVKTRQGDGYYGWKEEAPFDAVIVTAAAGHVPPPLIRQLKPGGAMVIPVGSMFMVQQLVLVRKDEVGAVTTKQILPVRFVPLTGDH